MVWLTLLHSALCFSSLTLLTWSQPPKKDIQTTAIKIPSRNQIHCIPLIPLLFVFSILLPLEPKKRLAISSDSGRSE